MTHYLKFLIADDKRDICESIKDSLKIELQKFNLVNDEDYEIKIVFTDHAYEHGCNEIRNGYRPNICIFDLVFNGYSGIDLFKFILKTINNNNTDPHATRLQIPNLCIYTGVEKTYEKRKDAEILASQMAGLVNVISKPNINEILEWLDVILIEQYKLKKKIEDSDPFDLL